MRFFLCLLVNIAGHSRNSPSASAEALPGKVSVNTTVIGYVPDGVLAAVVMVSVLALAE